ncbi:MAG TPA: ABC transporter ATP-binding protein [Planctomycetota bacterium]|jgi:lipoprotein-releasing system ATP-binding protein|nr:ABC transporter ATP-binding protein [Planctomycetota bacterium]
MNDLPIYSARKLQKDYRANGLVLPVLKGIDIDIHRGEILSIVGHSGVGKSTLLNLLGLLDTPTSGSMIYRGLEGGGDVDLMRQGLKSRARLRNREFGFVFQFYHLLPDLSVIENVLLPSMILFGRNEFRSRRPSLLEKAERLLDRVGISARKDFAPSRLSGGERQRAAIARALFNEPKVVFCDEPTGNLDTATGSRLHNLILELNGAFGVSFVLVTHDLDLAGLAHRKLVMLDGVFVS